jgi:hypothetical protein
MEDKMELNMGLRNAAAVVFSLIITFFLGMRYARGIHETNSDRGPASKCIGLAVFDPVSSEWLSTRSCVVEENRIKLPSYRLAGYVADVDTRGRFPHFSVRWEEDQQTYLVDGENLRTRREMMFIDYIGNCSTCFEDTFFR